MLRGFFQIKSLKITSLYYYKEVECKIVYVSDFGSDT